MRYLHIYNKNEVESRRIVLNIDGSPLNVSLKPGKWLTNLKISTEEIIPEVSFKDVEYEISTVKKIHPDQVAFNKRYVVQSKKYGKDFLHYALIGNKKNPEKILITFPGISNFDNVNYRLSALTSAQAVLCDKVLIIAFQDYEGVYGNYMYKTENGTPVKQLVYEFINDILNKYDLNPEDLIFYGNSKGGSICFDYLDLYEDAYFYIDIPQIDLYNYQSQNDLLRFSLGAECRNYHYHLEKITQLKSTRITYSFAEEDYDASRGVPIKSIPGIEVNMLKDMPHSGAAMRFVLRQISKIAQHTGTLLPVMRPALMDSVKLKGPYMYFKRRLGAFTKEDDLKSLYTEIRFTFQDRPDINISLNQSFNSGSVVVDWRNGFDYMKHLPHLGSKAYLVVYYKYREFIYPLAPTFNVI